MTRQRVKAVSQFVDDLPDRPSLDLNKVDILGIPRGGHVQFEQRRAASESEVLRQEGAVEYFNQCPADDQIVLNL